ncbi:MAG: MBL fold metallo-hydrolase [Fervidicoccaceae archaeon]
MVELRTTADAEVSETGAILLGKMFEVDSFAWRAIRVVSHFHSDHALNLSKSKKFASHIVATPPTIEALILMGHSLHDEKLLPVDYGRTIRFGDEALTLVKSSHVLGSAQILVETSDGRRVGYTSDFKFPGTKIMSELDALIIDATYGSESMVRPFKNEVDLLFSDLVLDLLSKGRPLVVRGYHGKLQEAMHILRKFGIEAPFIMPEKVYGLTKMAEKFGMRIGNYFSENSIEGKELLRDGWFIYMMHSNSRRVMLPNHSEITLTGWFFLSPLKKIYENSRGEKWIVALSDHADFEDTMYYVEEARPKSLIIDGYRTSVEIAESFARAVKRRLGLEAAVMPKMQGTKEED